MDTLPTMRRSGMASRLASLLAALALLVATGSVAAHPVAKEPALSAPPAVEVVVPQAVVPAPSAAPDPTGALPSAVAGALVLGAVFAVTRRPPRHALAVSLVLLLTIFAFENALHSVHHGFDAQQYEECVVAAVSAHLAAVSVDGVVETAFILAIAGTAAEPDFSSPPIRLLGPNQDRAPPVPTA